MIKTLGLLATLCLLAACSKDDPDLPPSSPFRVTTFQWEQGWGYFIAINGKNYIRQPYIPAISGKHAFRSQNDALKTGQYVCGLIRQRKLPALRVSDLQKLGIVADSARTGPQ